MNRRIRVGKSGRGALTVLRGTRSPDIPHFIEDKYDLDSYLLQFEDMLLLQTDPKLIWQSFCVAIWWESFERKFQVLAGRRFTLPTSEGGAVPTVNCIEQGYRQQFREVRQRT